MPREPFLSLTLMLALLLSAPPATGSAIESFFIGTTEGAGHVDVILSGRHAMRDHGRDHGRGRIDGEGALVLDQVVEEQGKPARRRIWRLVRTGDNRIIGTISDARGTVAGELTATSLHLRYKLKEGPSVEQWITLQPGGRTDSNRMIFRRFGLKVATVELEINKVEKARD
jgi:hypothetical protein